MAVVITNPTIHTIKTGIDQVLRQTYTTTGALTYIKDNMIVEDTLQNKIKAVALKKSLLKFKLLRISLWLIPLIGLNLYSIVDVMKNSFYEISVLSGVIVIIDIILLIVLLIFLIGHYICKLNEKIKKLKRDIEYLKG